MVVAKPDPLYDYMNEDSAKPNNEKYCAELSQKIQELKGKPQRRYAAQQRYDLECK
jgi:nucleoid-associated protein YejK